MEIRALSTDSEAEKCAEMMESYEPWKTLGRGYAESLDIIKDPSREVYLALVGGEILGFIILELKGAFIGYIKSICISTDYRGKGMGTSLMEFAERRILSETPNVFICVSDFNTRAMNFYLDRGYEVIGEIKNYIIEGSSEILLRKTTGPLTG
jgi:ribosomal protein S18 acetylase RimI-like enzyme